MTDGFGTGLSHEIYGCLTTGLRGKVIQVLRIDTISHGEHIEGKEDNGRVLGILTSERVVSWQPRGLSISDEILPA